MKCFLTLMLSLQLFYPLFSCGNEYGFTLDGKRIHTRYFYLSARMLKFDTEKIQERLDALALQTESGKATFKTWSDISVNLMKLGKVDSALRILLPLVEKHPDEYNLLSNLGTCYELNGNLTKALEYISKGYKINPSSHFGSEWIHVKILEAKIKEKNTPGWLDHNNIFELAELIKQGNDNISQRRIERINRNFFYQLRTRAPFTPAPNKVMANLLETIADFNMEYGTYENALLGYIYALEFEGSNWLDRKIKAKIKSLNKKRDNMSTKPELPDAFIKMMKRSEINPDIALMGIDEFAHKLDAVDLEEARVIDSLEILKDQLTISAKENKKNLQARLSREVIISKIKNEKYLFLGIGVLFGTALSFLLFRLKRQKMKPN